MPPHELAFTHKAAKQFSKLTPDVQKRLVPRIDALGEDPRPNGCEKLEGESNAYRIRVGDYRIVYTIDDGWAQVTIARIAHRRDVYRGL